MVSPLTQQATDQAETAGPVLLKYAPRAEVAEPFWTPVDHALGVESQVRAHHLALLLQEEAVVGPCIAPRRFHRCCPGRGGYAAVEMGVQECRDSFDVRTRDWTELDWHGGNGTEGRGGISRSSQIRLSPNPDLILVKMGSGAWRTDASFTAAFEIGTLSVGREGSPMSCASVQPRLGRRQM